MFFFYFIAIFTNVMEIQIRQGITIIVPGCRDAAITCWVNEDTDTLMQLKIANFSSVAWPAYFTSIRVKYASWVHLVSTMTRHDPSLSGARILRLNHIRRQ